MRMKIRFLFIFFIFTVSLASSNAFALTCYLGSDTSATQDSDEIGVMAYLASKGDGERIWTSTQFTRNITCRSDLTNGGSENVYVYPFPKRTTETLPQGVKLGLIFNGKDLGTFDTSSDVTAGRHDTGWQVNSSPSSRTMTFQIYMVKTGTISTNGVSKVTVFQLDGAGGLNAVEGVNYSIALTGWNNIGSVSCTGSNPPVLPKISKVKVNDILKNSVTVTVPNRIGMLINCTSPTSGIVNHIKSLTTVVTFKGDAFAGNSHYFSTNKEGIGLAIKAENKEVHPGDIVEFNTSLSSGHATHYIPLEVTPYIPSLSLNSPAWLFSSAADNVSYSLPYTFSINDIHLD